VTGKIQSESQTEMDNLDWVHNCLFHQPFCSIQPYDVIPVNIRVMQVNILLTNCVHEDGTKGEEEEGRGEWGDRGEEKEEKGKRGEGGTGRERRREKEEKGKRGGRRAGRGDG